MDWEIPSFVEVKMDSEIGAYQDDFGNIPDVSSQAKPVIAQTNESLA